MNSVWTNKILAKLAQSEAHLTLVQEVASLSPNASRLTQPSIPPWVGKMSTCQMMVIGGICAFQIGSLHHLGNQDMAAKCPVCSPERWWFLLIKE